VDFVQFCGFRGFRYLANVAFEWISWPSWVSMFRQTGMYPVFSFVLKNNKMTNTATTVSTVNYNKRCFKMLLYFVGSFYTEALLLSSLVSQRVGYAYDF